MYPDSALSAGQPAVMAVVVAASLAAWLILMFPPPGSRTAHPQPTTPDRVQRKQRRP